MAETGPGSWDEDRADEDGGKIRISDHVTGFSNDRARPISKQPDARVPARADARFKWETIVVALVMGACFMVVLYYVVVGFRVPGTSWVVSPLSEQNAGDNTSSPWNGVIAITAFAATLVIAISRSGRWLRRDRYTRHWRNYEHDYPT